jgi:hypothetical protein
MGFHAAPTLKQAWDFVQQKSPTADAEGLFDHQVEPRGGKSKHFEGELERLKRM